MSVSQSSTGATVERKGMDTYLMVPWVVPYNCFRRQEDKEMNKLNLTVK